MIDMTMTSTDEIVLTAERALSEIDAEIDRLRQAREKVNADIASLLVQRKPLARLVKAAKGRK